MTFYEYCFHLSSSLFVIRFSCFVVSAFAFKVWPRSLDNCKQRKRKEEYFNPLQAFPIRTIRIIFTKCNPVINLWIVHLLTIIKTIWIWMECIFGNRNWTVRRFCFKCFAICTWRMYTFVWTKQQNISKKMCTNSVIAQHFQGKYIILPRGKTTFSLFSTNNIWRCALHCRPTNKTLSVSSKNNDGIWHWLWVNQSTSTNEFRKLKTTLVKLRLNHFKLKWMAMAWRNALH